MANAAMMASRILAPQIAVMVCSAFKACDLRLD